MSLEDTLRWAHRWPMDSMPDDYVTPEPEFRVNWRWLDLWEQENPNPGGGDNFAEWHAAYRLMGDRCWAAAHFPNLRVMDWTDEDVYDLRRLVARHICGVCGRADDSGCAKGC